MKEDGNVAFKSSNWKKAHELYTQALLIDPCNKATNAKLYFNRATVAAKVSILQILREISSGECRSIKNASECVNKADFALLETPNLISRKI